MDSIIINDTMADPLTAGMDNTCTLGSCSFVGVPIELKSGEIFGALCALDPKKYIFSAADAALLNCMATFFACVIELERTVDKLQNTQASLIERQTQYQLVDDNIQDLITILDSEGRIIKTTPSHYKVLGWHREVLEGLNFFEDIESEDQAVLKTRMHKLIASGEPQTFEHRVPKSDGSWVWLETTGSLMPNYADDTGSMVLCISRDITDRKNLEIQLANYSFEDTLTGISNLRMFKELLKLAVSLSKQSHQPLAVFQLNVDGFARVNAEFGPEAGNRILSEIGSRLKDFVKGSGIVSRYGGDEFILLLYKIRYEDVADYARKCLDLFSVPFTANAQQTKLTCSIGISRYTTEIEDEITLMNQSQLSMYNAKASNGNRFCIYQAPS